MKLAPAVRFPLRRKITTLDPAAAPDAVGRLTVTFYLRSHGGGKDKRRYYYECTHPGCHGCGCPTFINEDLKDGTDIPDAILEHMARHVGFVHSEAD